MFNMIKRLNVQFKILQFHNFIGKIVTAHKSKITLQRQDSRKAELIVLVSFVDRINQILIILIRSKSILNHTHQRRLLLGCYFQI